MNGMKRLSAVIVLLIIVISAIFAPGTALASYNNETDLTKKLDTKIYYMMSLDDDSIMFNKREKKCFPRSFCKTPCSTCCNRKLG